MSVTLITWELPDPEAGPSPHWLPSADSLVLSGSPAVTLPGRCPVLCPFTALFRSLPRQECLPPQVPAPWLGQTPFSTSFFGDLSSDLVHTAHDPDGRACLVLHGLCLYSGCVPPEYLAPSSHSPLASCVCPPSPVSETLDPDRVLIGFGDPLCSWTPGTQPLDLHLSCFFTMSCYLMVLPTKLKAP